MRVFVVYAHPSSDSFTYMAKESFIRGLKDAGHEVEISDLYAMKFNPVMSESEYRREAFYRTDISLPSDVISEQKKIDRADAIAFIFPDFWTAAPAMLDGWFQRVWTYGYAYGPERKMATLRKAVFLMTMGGSLADSIRREQIEAIKTVMIGDRIRDRAEKCEFFVFDQMTRGYGNDDRREKLCKIFCDKAYQLGLNFAV